MRLRAYRRGDRDACLTVFDSNVPDAFAVAERPDFEHFLDDLPGPYLVMEDDGGGVVGCGGYAFEDDGTTVSLCWGMVKSDRHGEGLGMRLLTARVEAALTDPACEALRLGTAIETAGFFEKLGFRVVERHIDGFGPGLDSVEMRWERP